jgi:hypothetical protein
MCIERTYGGEDGRMKIGVIVVVVVNTNRVIGSLRLRPRRELEPREVYVALRSLRFPRSVVAARVYRGKTGWHEIRPGVLGDMMEDGCMRTNLGGATGIVGKYGGRVVNRAAPFARVMLGQE